MRKIITIGEALIDFIPDVKGVKLKNITNFERVPGGAPANVAAAAAKLGAESCFVGKVGDDAFGEFIIDTLKENKVNTDYVLKTSEANTALAFLSVDEDGKRDFLFYRNPSADKLLYEDELDSSLFVGNILHFCSIDLIEAPVKYAHKKAIKYTAETGGLISFDPNIRFSLWKREDLKNTVVEFMNFADILKISDDEIQFITGIINPSDAVKFLFTRYPKLKMIFFTKGAEGALAFTRTNSASHKGYKVRAIDDTGAGDAFIAGILYFISRQDKMIDKYEERELKEMLDLACAAGSIAVTKKGAVNSMPDMNEIAEFLNGRI